MPALKLSLARTGVLILIYSEKSRQALFLLTSANNGISSHPKPTGARFRNVTISGNGECLSATMLVVSTKTVAMPFRATLGTFLVPHLAEFFGIRDGVTSIQNGPSAFILRFEVRAVRKKSTLELKQVCHGNFPMSISTQKSP